MSPENRHSGEDDDATVLGLTEPAPVVPVAYAEDEPDRADFPGLFERQREFLHASWVVPVAAVVAAGVVIGLCSYWVGRHSASPTSAAVQTSQAAPAPSSVLATTPAPTGRYALPACYSLTEPPTERPTLVTFQYCGDGGAQLDHMTWTAWGPNSADGQGYFSFKICQPSCAEGGWAHYPARIHAANPAPLSRNSGCPDDVQFYTDLTLAFPLAAPEGANGQYVNGQYDGLPAIRLSTEPNQPGASQLGRLTCW